MKIKNSKKNKPLKFKVGIFIVSFLFLMSLISLFIPYSASEIDLSRSYEAPSFSHLFGLDENGRDVFFQIIEGSKVSLTVALSVTLISLLVGLIFGTISGYGDERVDLILMRVVDMIYAFPNFLLALSLMAVLGSSISNLILVMSLTTWATFARLIRGEVMHLKKKLFVLSATSLGISWYRKITRHIWSNLIPLLCVQVVLTLAAVILTESGLSFLGIGVPLETVTWGSLLRSGRQALVEAPHLSLFPGLFLFFLILGFHLLGQGLQAWLSPYKNKF